MSNAAPYRTPPRPGFVGSYNWSATLTGIVLLLLSNVAATQLIAFRFGYPSALGTPLLRSSRFAVYQPLAWSIWVLRYAGSRDPRVRRPVQEGVVTLGGGSVLTIAVFFLMNMRRARRLSRNTEDLHGSARRSTGFSGPR